MHDRIRFNHLFYVVAKERKMHLVVGYVRVVLAQFLAVVFRILHFDWIGRRVVNLSCAAFTAGGGLDDVAIEVVRGMGHDGIRFLQEASECRGERSVPSLMLEMVKLTGDARDGE